jgi:hypothetical protein
MTSARSRCAKPKAYDPAMCKGRGDHTVDEPPLHPVDKRFACASPPVGKIGRQKLFDQQSMEADQEKRRRLVWEIDKRLQEDVARPIIFHIRAATCWQPYVNGITIMVNSIFNGWRFEDVWLAR